MDKKIILFRIHHKKYGYVGSKYPQYFFGYDDMGITRYCFVKRGKGRVFTLQNILRNGYSSSMMYQLIKNDNISIECIENKIDKETLLRILKEKRNNYRDRTGIQWKYFNGERPYSPNLKREY